MTRKLLRASLCFALSLAPARSRFHRALSTVSVAATSWPSVALGIPVGLTFSSPDVGVVFQVQFSLSKAGEEADGP